MAQIEIPACDPNNKELPQHELEVDPFYSDENMERLQKSIDDLNAGKGTLHEVNLNYNDIIDFPLPAIIRNTMEDTEAALREYGELGPYLNWVDTLDNVCKECYVTHVISKSQWKKIMSRYTV